MKLPADSIIASDKIRRYLLVPRRANDKSKFLAAAGYTLENWEKLEQDIRSAVADKEAVESRSDEHGTFYEVRTNWQTPNGRNILVVTVWIRLVETGQTKFVTLYPDQEAKK